MGGAELTSERGLVSNGDVEDVVTMMEKVHEVAVMVEEEEEVLETARFTSVMSPPDQHLMMAEQVYTQWCPTGHISVVSYRTH